MLVRNVFCLPQLNRPILMSLFCVIVAFSFPLSVTLSPISHFLLFFNSYTPSPFAPDTSFHLRHILHHVNLLVLLLHFLFSSFSPFCIFSLWVVLRTAPMFVGRPLVSCRYVVTMWLSWTLLGLWMLIWILAFPTTLLRHRINSVRNYECPPNYTWLGLRCFVKTAFYDSW